LKNKIALEEHFAIDLTIDQSKIYSQPVVWERLKANLLDIEQQRLERMEQGGTAFSMLSLNSPGIQGIPNVKEAIDVSRRANDVLAEHVSRHPTKLGGFAALPMQDPEAAAKRANEAHLPTEEAQASPRARVQGAHALARGQGDAQAQARKGAKAPVRLTVIGAR